MGARIRSGRCSLLPPRSFHSVLTYLFTFTQGLSDEIHGPYLLSVCPMRLRTPIRTRPPSVLEPLSIHFKSVLGEGTLSRVVCTNDNSLYAPTVRGEVLFMFIQSSTTGRTHGLGVRNPYILQERNYMIEWWSSNVLCLFREPLLRAQGNLNRG